MRRVGLATLAAGVVWALSATAQARPSPLPGSGDVAKRARLFFDADMVYWQGTLFTPRMGGQLGIRNAGAGVIGWRRIPIGLGAAFALSERWLVGGRVDVAVEPERDGDVGVRAALSPFAQLFFLRDRNVRPFVLARLGLGRSHTFARNDADEVVAVGPQSLYPTLGAGVGAHVFITENMSFDALLVVDHRWNFVRRDLGPDVDAQGEGATWNLENGTITTALAFGFSSWF
jgi:hypothetical protein